LKVICVNSVFLRTLLEMLEIELISSKCQTHGTDRSIQTGAPADEC